MKISKKHWLYQLAEFGGLHIGRRLTLCYLLRRALMGFFMCAVLLLFGVAVVVAICMVTITPIYAFFQWRVNGVPYGPGGIASSAVLGFAVLGTAWNRGVFHWLGDKALGFFLVDGVKPRPKPREPGLIRTTYRALKERVCPFIEVEP